LGAGPQGLRGPNAKMKRVAQPRIKKKPPAQAGGSEFCPNVTGS
jgi:hypothetical protein